MKSTVQPKENCETEVHCEVPAEAVEARRQKLLNHYQKSLRLPGFRPGKAPLDVIKKKLGARLEEDLSSELVREALNAALREHDLPLLQIRAVLDDAFQPDGAFTFRAILAVEPTFELPEYKAVPLQAPKVSVTDEMIDATIDSLRERFAEFVEVSGRPLASGDIAVIDYAGKLDGQALAEALPELPQTLTGRDDHWLPVADEGFIPGFATQLQGMAAGDHNEQVAVEFPAEFPVEALRGKRVVYGVTLRGIREKQLPALDDALANRLVAGHTLEQLRELTSKRLVEHQQDRLRDILTEQMTAYLDRSVETDLPDALVSNEAQHLINSMVERGQKQGVSDEVIMAEQEKIIASGKEQARRNVKMRFILARIAEKEGLEVGDRELAMVVQQVITDSNKAPKKALEEMKKSGQIENIRQNLLLQKALAFILDAAAVTEIDVPAGPHA
jgi:trigger factor